MDWIINNWVELAGAILGLAFVVLEIKQHVLLWPVGIAMSIFYVFVFFDARFYADMTLQFYYIVVSIYGWYWWLFGHQKTNQPEILITHLPKKSMLPLTLITCALTFIMAFVLKNYTDSPVPIGDAFTTALGVTATWMLARKYLEQWLLWIVANAVSLGLYMYKDLYPTAVLFFVYLILAFVGYYNWKRMMKL